jgi:hypothetical protein
MPGVRRIPFAKRRENMPQLKRLLIVLLVALAASPTSAQMRSLPSLNVRQGDGTRRGFYYNCGFGYAFYIPRGFVGEGNPDGTPQHGVRISLSERPESYVWVDGSYNALDWRTLDDAARFYREALNERGENVSLVGRQVMSLGRLRALRLMFSYRERGAGDTVIEEVVLARRKSKGDAEMVYTLGLKTQRTNYERSREMLQRVLRTWQLKPLPCA